LERLFINEKLNHHKPLRTLFIRIYLKHQKQQLSYRHDCWMEGGNELFLIQILIYLSEIFYLNSATNIYGILTDRRHNTIFIGLEFFIKKYPFYFFRDMIIKCRSFFNDLLLWSNKWILTDGGSLYVYKNEIAYYLSGIRFMV